MKVLTAEARQTATAWEVTDDWRRLVMANAARERSLEARPALHGDGDPGYLTEMRALWAGVSLERPWRSVWVWWLALMGLLLALSIPMVHR